MTKNPRNFLEPAHTKCMYYNTRKLVPPPMLATLGDPPAGERWAFESKWDGQRAIATTGNKAPALWSRAGNDITETFSEIADTLIEVLGRRETILDGEIVALDKGVPSFARLQHRMHGRTHDQRHIDLTMFYVFDVLEIDGVSTMNLPYLERREELANLSLERDHIKVPPHWLNIDGPRMLEVARRRHLEGIIAKRVTSTYQPGERSPNWIKTPIRANTEAIICGFVPGSGGAGGGIGSLILGAHDETGLLIYIGNVGAGFTARQRRDLCDQLIVIKRSVSPFMIAPPRAVTRCVQWAEPILVCDVEYREYTAHGLRHPSFKGLRSDKTGDDVILPTER